MKGNWRENGAIKALAFMMAVAAFATAAILGWYQLANYDVIWGGYSNGNGYTTRYLERQDIYSVSNLVDLYFLRDSGAELSSYQDQLRASLEEYYDISNTNLRWQLLDGEGTVVYGNWTQERPAQPEGLWWADYSSGYTESGDTWDLVVWLDGDMAVNDVYARAARTLDEWREGRVGALAICLVCAGVGLLLTVYLCASAGHRRGRKGIVLNWFHRIPGDLLLVVLLGLAAVLASFGQEIVLYGFSYIQMPMSLQLLGVGLLMGGAAALGISSLMTVAVRLKTHTLLRNTVIWRVGHWCRRTLRRVGRAMPLVWKAALVGCLYLLVTPVMLDRGSDGLWLLISLAALAYLCVWAYHWKRIRVGTREIIGGNPDYHIDSRRMPPDLKAHADELNNLGQSISAAVEDRMRSEHFKAELITNVSHDLKTPLTSIINYVDLLKKEDISNPKAVEYIEVLDRKSQRLKKLTEDLVEASKASTGTLSVTLGRLDLEQLVDQALAEYEDRLVDKGLTVVRTLPSEPVWVRADGRRLWRVLDNLLSNCAKYALEGTRIYLEIQVFDTSAALSIKNISRDPLNVPPETLMERFVRGDASRTTEGSGLGLSIAQSLTDLQHGKFEISIDGDLFKAVVTLPLEPEEVDPEGE